SPPLSQACGSGTRSFRGSLQSASRFRHQQIAGLKTNERDRCTVLASLVHFGIRFRRRKKVWSLTFLDSPENCPQAMTLGIARLPYKIASLFVRELASEAIHAALPVQRLSQIDRSCFTGSVSNPSGDGSRVKIIERPLKLIDRCQFDDPASWQIGRSFQRTIRSDGVVHCDFAGIFDRAVFSRAGQ